jgi:UrcA family protein
MDKMIFTRGGRHVALAFSILLLSSAQAFAASVSEVVVTAPRTIHPTPVGRSPTTGGPIETMTIKGRVSYADLDLSKVADDATLKDRITAEAKNACDELDKLAPLVDRDPKCVDKAVKGAMAQVSAKMAHGT